MWIYYTYIYIHINTISDTHIYWNYVFYIYTIYLHTHIFQSICVCVYTSSTNLRNNTKEFKKGPKFFELVTIGGGVNIPTLSSRVYVLNHYINFLSKKLKLNGNLIIKIQQPENFLKILNIWQSRCAPQISQKQFVCLIKLIWHIIHITHHEIQSGTFEHD